MLCPLPSVEELSSTLTRCCKSQNAAHILRLCAYLVGLGLKTHPSLGNDLVFVLFETRSLHCVQHTFDRLLYRDEHAWSSVIRGHTRNGDSPNTFSLYRLMLGNESFSLNGNQYVSLLKACSASNDLESGLELHVEIVRRNLLEANAFIGSSLVQMYARCGSLEMAQDVFDELRVRDVYSWNALISVFVEHGHCEEALACLHRMQSEGTIPDAFTFVCSLKACSAIRALLKGFNLHSEITRKGYIEENIFIGSALVDMYAKCGALAEARDVLENLPSQDTFTWTALLAGYVKHGHGEKALDCFNQMQDEGIDCSTVTFVCSLKACVNVGSLEIGQKLHAQIARTGLLEKGVHIGSTLVDMYSKCGSLRIAQEVFDGLQSRNEILWNTLIAGYVEQGQSAEALYRYEKMQLEGFFPDSVTYICSLKACGCLGCVEKGYEIHAEIVKRGFEGDVVVGTAIVDMYVKSSSLTDAREALDMMPFRNAVTWNALIAGYVEQEHVEESLTCYEQMHLDGISPDAVTFICCTKVCGSLGATEKGHDFHAEASKRGLELDVIVGGTLVDMYCRFGWFIEAQIMFDKLSIRDDVSWNALIGGYLDFGHIDKALEYFERMQKEGISQDAFSLVYGLKTYGSIGMKKRGQELHIEIVKKGLLEMDNFLCSALIDMYAHCGSLADAQAVVDMNQSQSRVTWNALMTRFVEHGHCEEVLDCYECMECEGIVPDAVTFVCMLKACGSMKASKEGQQIHSRIVKRGLERNVQLGSTLVDMYGKFNCLAEAEETFAKLPVRNVVSWNVLIANFLEHGSCDRALSCFDKMDNEGIPWDATTAVSGLKAWANLGSTDGAQQMHTEILRKGLENAPLVGNTLIDVYNKVGLLTEAKEMFHKILIADRVSWNALIAGNVEQGQAEDAFGLFEQMRAVRVCPDAITFTFILKACGCERNIGRGREVHAECVKMGFLEADVFVDTALVDMYVDCGSLADAQKVFHKLPLRNLASWNAFLTGYVEHGLGEEALNLFDHMQDEGIVSDSITIICVLKACGMIGNSFKGRGIHAFLTKIGFDREAVVGNALVHMYDKCGSVLEAKDMFDRLPVQDIVSWTTLIAGYAGHGDGEASLNSFEVMQKEGVPGSTVTFSCSVKACGSIAFLAKGRALHSQITKIGLETESHIGNVLVDMYSKCGLGKTMQEVFDRLVIRDVIAWNTLIAGYAQLGESDMAFYTFKRMSDEHIMPDNVTLTSVLNACSNEGLVDEGRLYFLDIKNEFGCIQTFDHYTCMVDLLGRAGNLNCAISLIEWMPFQPGTLLWNALLGACRKWGDAQLGRHAFEHAVWLDANATAAYVCLSNLYADVEIADNLQASYHEENLRIQLYDTG